MARPTSLRILNERPIPTEDAELAFSDRRPTVEAFPSREPPPAPEGNSDAEAILEVLRKSHDRISGEVRQATDVASAALERADALRSTLDDLRTRTESAERHTETVAAATHDQLRRNELAMGTLAGDRATKAAAVLSRLSSFAFDRLPALLALGSAFWLWRGTLADPQPMQLAALALYGTCVIGPAVYLGLKGRG